MADAVAIAPRGGPHNGTVVRVTFTPVTPLASLASRRRQASASSKSSARGKTEAVQLDAPQLTALMTTGARQKRRQVPLARIPMHVQQAVLAIEDQSFYSHPGINVFRVVAAAFTQHVRRPPAPVGNSTITQQLSRMFFQADEFNAELRSGTRSYMR